LFAHCKLQEKWTLQLLHAVEYLHTLSLGKGCIIHHDLKPEILFIDRFNDLKVGDFGLAREIFAEGDDVGIGGTPGWMAPEQGDEDHTR